MSLVCPTSVGKCDRESCCIYHSPYRLALAWGTSAARHGMALVLGTCAEALSYAARTVPLIEPFSAQQLSGGYCNFVYRIHCHKSALPTAIGTGNPAGTHHSVILKSYPPYVATNPSLQMSTDRCRVELAALSLQDSAEAMRQLDPPASYCRIPRVVHSDTLASVIVMEDAGDGLVSLLDALTHDVQTSPGSPPLPQDQLLPSSWPGMTVTMLARALHGFLAAVALQGSDPAFDNPAAWAVLKTHFGRAAAAVQRFHSPQLSDWVARAPAFLPPASSVTSLIFGDLWPNSVHFDPGSETIWVLDWEMARRGTGRADAEQLLDNLWVMAQNPGKYRSETVQQLIQQLQLHFLGGAGCDWRAGREAEFVRSAAMLAAFPHWGLSEALPQVMQQAVQEAAELQGRRQAASQDA